MNNIKAIIWDWARTLYDVEDDREFLGAQDILEYCRQKNYRLVLVSLVTVNESEPGTSLETRNLQISRSPLKKYFDKIITTAGDKNAAYDEIIKFLDLPAGELLMIDDRTVRGISYANKHGIPCIWLQRGKFAQELPNEQTGQPTYTIHSLDEITNIL